MSKAMRILHGEFGRAMLVQLDRHVTEHAHRTCQLLFRVDGGEIDVNVQKQRHRLGDQDVVMLNAWQDHAYECVEEQSPATVLSIYVEPAWLKKCGREFSCCMHPRFFSVPCGNMGDAARGLVDQIVELITYNPSPTSQEVESLVREIVLSIASKYSDWQRLSSFETVGGAACDARIRKILSIMCDSVGQPMLMEDLARQARMSRPHFFHLFRKDTHLTPMVCSNMLRMEAAVQQVSETSDSLLDISLRLGFESPGNFTRFFNMQQGVPPSQYRRTVMLLDRAEPTVTPTARREYIGNERVRLHAHAA